MPPDADLEWTAHRSNMNTATNHGSRWLFGRRAGQPMTPNAPAAVVHDLGISGAGRAAAIRQHVLEMPAPVVADAPGYHPGHHHPARRAGRRHREPRRPRGPPPTVTLRLDPSRALTILE